MVHPGEIYFLPKVKLGKAEHGRPCLVLRILENEATICYFSTRFDLMERGDVVIEKTDSEFAATGLKESSYIPSDPIPDIPLSLFKDATLLGCATGEFRKRVEEWYGLPLS